jgi:RNA polymerase sigma-70 factor (ECF subfamily)
MAEQPLDDETVSKASRGDRHSLDVLVERHYQAVWKAIMRFTGDPNETDTLTQEAFLRAWQRLGSFRGDSAFSTWMHRLTVNVVLGHHRARSRRPEGHAEPEETALAAAVAPGSAPGEGVDLERAIARLPERAREVFVLHDVEGHSHEEISALAGMAVGTSKAHLHRARRLLREALAS